MNPQLNYKDYILLFIAVLTFFASLFCALRIPSNAPDIMASIGLGIVSILFFIVFIFSKNQDEDSLLDSASKLAETQFDSFIETYKSMLDLIFEEIEAMDFSTTPLDDIRSYRDFLAMYAHTQTPELSLDKHEKIKFLNTQLDEIIKSHPLAPIPEPCPITALQEEIKQKLEEQAVLPGSITRVEYDNLLDIPTPILPFHEAILPQLAGIPTSESKEQDGNPEPIYLGIPSVPDEEEMQKIKEKAATVATDIIADANRWLGMGTQTPTEKLHVVASIGKSDDELMQSLKEEAFPLTPTPEVEKELMQSLREEAIEASFDISKDAIKASPKRTKSGRFAKKSK